MKEFTCDIKVHPVGSGWIPCGLPARCFFRKTPNGPSYARCWQHKSELNSDFKAISEEEFLISQVMDA